MDRIKDKKIRLAVTGLIGSGKSLVLKHAQTLGYAVFSADVASAQILTERWSEIQHCFPELHAHQNNSPEARALLWSVLLEDRGRRRVLEAVLHPQIFAHYQAAVAQNPPILVAEIPLLAECDWGCAFDITLCVTLERQERYRRLYTNRNIGWDKAAQIDALHLAAWEKVRYCHHHWPEYVLQSESQQKMLLQALCQGVGT